MLLDIKAYWGIHDTAPQWRIDKNIGKPIR
jgi:hypothetical protein